jgi:hypothetical protein
MRRSILNKIMLFLLAIIVSLFVGLSVKYLDSLHAGSAAFFFCWFLVELKDHRAIPNK